MDLIEVGEAIQDKILSVPPADFLIMSSGAVLGWYGYTPVTALVNLALGAAKSIGDYITGLNSLVSSVTSGKLSPGVQHIPLIGWLVPPGALAPTTMDPRDRLVEAHVRGLNALVGVIESYAYTRPGFIPGIAQAIGEIIPG